MKSTPISELHPEDESAYSDDDPLDQPEPAPKVQEAARPIRRRTLKRGAEDHETIRHNAWTMVTSRPFLQAVAYAFIMIVSVTLSPVPRMAAERLPVSVTASGLAVPVVASLISAIAVTVARPPPLIA